MHQKLLAFLKVFIASVAILALPGTGFAQLKVIISGGFSAAYEELLPEFEMTTGMIYHAKGMVPEAEEMGAKAKTAEQPE